MLTTALLMVGCGTADAGTTDGSRLGSSSIDGSVAGRTVDIKETMGVHVLSEDGSVELTVVGLENRTALCELLHSHNEWASTGLAITFVREPLAGATTMPSDFPFGTYAVGRTTATKGANVTARVSFYETDRTCTNLVPKESQKATEGNVTLESIDAGYAKGRFDVTFGGERVTGKFEVPLCPAIFSDVASPARPCEPG